MKKLRPLLLFMIAVVQLARGLSAAESEFYRLFKEAKIKKTGFLYDPDLVLTNSFGVKQLNGVLSFSSLRDHYEVAGIRIGMNMSQVVDAWGQPRTLYTHCGIGPRFWYSTTNDSRWGDISLFFRSDRLEKIYFSPPGVQQLTFDNGLNPNSPLAHWEKALGTNAIWASDRGSAFISSANNLRVEFTFQFGPDREVRRIWSLWITPPF